MIEVVIGDGRVWKILDNKFYDMISGETKELNNKVNIDKLFQLANSVDNPESLTPAQQEDLVDKIIDIANHVGPEYYHYLNHHLNIDELVARPEFSHLA